MTLGFCVDRWDSQTVDRTKAPTTRQAQGRYTYPGCSVTVPSLICSTVQVGAGRTYRNIATNTNMMPACTVIGQVRYFKHMHNATSVLYFSTGRRPNLAKYQILPMHAFLR